MKHAKPIIAICSLSLAAALSACAATKSASGPQTEFFDRLSAQCGKAFSGTLVSKDTADADLAGKPMAMHIASCSKSEIKIPFHIEMKPGTWNRSRTWIVTRNKTGLRLKHDHRHEDGTSDKVTMYGGDTAQSGAASRQEFPVDAESIAMFKVNDLPASVTNIWAIEIDDTQYTYELSRKNRLFRVTFDLTKPITPPPLPWGWGK